MHSSSLLDGLYSSQKPQEVFQLGSDDLQRFNSKDHIHVRNNKITLYAARLDAIPARPVGMGWHDKCYTAYYPTLREAEEAAERIMRENPERFTYPCVTSIIADLNSLDIKAVNEMEISLLFKLRGFLHSSGFFDFIRALGTDLDKEGLIPDYYEE
jgi:hypothetical protein